MKLLCALLLVVFSSVASAASITLTFSDEEQRALLTILDVATGGAKPGGLELAKAATYFANKFALATQQAAQTQTSTPPRTLAPNSATPPEPRATPDIPVPPSTSSPPKGPPSPGEAK